MAGPLHGVRVLEFSQVIAGPMAGMVLADMGADVVKVESPAGDPFRQSASVVPGTSKQFQWYNRGKRSLVLDLSHREARDAVHRIVPAFDVVVCNYAPGVPERLEIDYDTLSRFRSDLIYARITGFGPYGPLSQLATIDIMTQAYAGVMMEEGHLDEEGELRRIAAPNPSDLMAALSLAVGVVGALYHRALTGEGQRVDASLFRGALASIGRSVMREPVSDAIFATPLAEQVRGMYASGAPFPDIVRAYSRGSLVEATGAVRRIYLSSYEAKDGALVLGAVSKRQRDALRSVIGIPDEGGDDPGFDPLDEANKARMAEVKREVARIMRTRTVAEWIEAFRAADAPAMEVRIPEDVADDPHASAFFVELEDELTGPQRQLDALFELSKSEVRAAGPAPVHGRHSEEVLREAGLSAGEVAALRASGALGHGPS